MENKGLKEMAKAFLKHDWKHELGLSSDPEDPKEDQDKHGELESQLKAIQTNFESQKLENEANKHIQNSTVKILKETIEKYKLHSEKLSKSNEVKMKKILIYEHFIQEYCKNANLDFELDSFKDLKKMHKLQDENLSLKYEETVRSLKETHENEIIKYQEKIKEILNLLKKEKIKSKKLSETAKKAIDYLKSKSDPKENPTEPIISKRPIRVPRKNQDFSSLLNQISSLKSDLNACKDYISKICKKFPIVLTKFIREDLEKFSKKLNFSEFQNKFSDILSEKKQLLDQINQMRGNIRVFCRVRPVLNRTEKSCAETFDRKVILRHPFMKTSKIWEFDHVFSESTSQSSVFSQIKDLIITSFDGYNICIFTYGQTGSGKTYTLEGPEDSPGLITRVCEEVFSQKEKRLTWDYKIKVSLLEVYNENLKDLLDQEKNKLKMMNGKIKGLEKAKISDIGQLKEILRFGCSSRSTGSNAINLHSSRSHLIMTLYIKGLSSSSKMKAKIQLVDLAGSERLNKSSIADETLIEAKHINLSLHVLGNVISAKSQKLSHVPFRNSVLTQVLQDSLMGEAKVLMIVQVSPEQANYEESVSSLNFAVSAKNTSLGIPKASLS